MVEVQFFLDRATKCQLDCLANQSANDNSFGRLKTDISHYILSLGKGKAHAEGERKQGFRWEMKRASASVGAQKKQMITATLR